jgi:cyclophilin family peptidyl-prolyl cis-trans isomerase
VRPPAQGSPAPEIEAAELRRTAGAEVRAMLASRDAAARTRAALAAGRIGDAQLAGAVIEPALLEPLLDDPVAGDTAAWALGRIPGGAKALAACLARSCAAAPAAARALAGPAAAKDPMVDALAAALKGPAAAEAGFALGVLARNKDAPVARARDALAAALQRPDARAGAVYAFSRMSRGDPVPLDPLLRDVDPWTRSLAARAWGKQGLPAGALAAALHDEDWRVRVEAARGLATASGAVPALVAAVPEAVRDLVKGARYAHVAVALFESAAQLGELALPAIPEPFSLDAATRAATTAVRCGAAMARDRIRKQLADTPSCGWGISFTPRDPLEPEWRSRRRTGALAAELAQERPELLPKAREALHDADARVRGAAAGAAGSALAEDLRPLLDDHDPYVVQEAAASLAKENAAASLDAALAAVQRLSAAHDKQAGDPGSDALAALVDLIAAGQPKATPQPVMQLLPAPSVVLHGAIGKMYKMTGAAAPAVPAEARQEPRAHVLRLRTSAGELVIDLRPDIAPLTSSALAALSKRGFYDGLTLHRVVPDFVVQGGDPRGDGDGGPGWALPDEHSPLRFLRGTLGIATSGPETGGSQFFLCHSPQPHLDGRYTIAGELREGAEVMDALQPGDTILSAAAE